MSKNNGDVVILIQDQEIRDLPVISQDEEAVYAGDLKLPKSDAQVRYYPGGGRAFIFGYQAPQLAEAENIARLEKSSILRSIFSYGAGGRNDMLIYVFLAVELITIIILRR